MSEKREACRPLNFNEQFLELLTAMEQDIIRLKTGESWEKLIKYQTLIAAGGYFGPEPKELLKLTWFDIIEKSEEDLFIFKKIKNPKQNRNVYFPKGFIKIANRNYHRLEPMNIHHLILSRKSNPMESVATTQFNTALKYYLNKFKIESPNASLHTLRKTFMEEAWKQLGSDERAYLTIGKMMGYKTKRQVVEYLGHQPKRSKLPFLRFK